MLERQRALHLQHLQQQLSARSTAADGGVDAAAAAAEEEEASNSACIVCFEGARDAILVPCAHQVRRFGGSALGQPICTLPASAGLERARVPAVCAETAQARVHYPRVGCEFCVS